MSIEPRDLGAMEKSVNDAAGRASRLWIGFLLFATLVAITTGTVTHKHLFLELPLKLPVLNVDLPLIGYFVAVPLFFVVFHFYVLLQLDGLALKIATYKVVLRRERPFSADQHLALQRLDSFIFTQVLVGTRDRREGRIGTLNRALAWISMIALPIGTLLLLLLTFLPYHRESVTWWHRASVLVDLSLVWFFWGRLAETKNLLPSAIAAAHRLRRSGAARLASDARRVTLMIARTSVVLSTVVALFAILVAVYPSEWIYGVRIRPLTGLLLEGEPDWVTGVPNSWLGSNRLVLPDANLGVEEKLIALSKNQEALAVIAKDKAAEPKAPRANITLSLRGRDLSYATLDRADLRQVDFTGAHLQAASFLGSRLQRAVLSAAQLQGATLTVAEMQGASLIEAHLQGADLQWARLHGADLSLAQLQGANLSGAYLQGANFDGARLQGADLLEAYLQGSDLSRAQLQGANLTKAQLQGASLFWAQLQGADLSGAQLQGADLTRTNVYRTACPVAPLNANAWRCLQASGASIADVSGIDTRRLLFVNVNFNSNEPELIRVEADNLPAFRKFVDDIVLEIPTERKELARKRVSVLTPGARTPDQDARFAEQWQQERLRSLSFPARRAQIIAPLACAANGAPHIARGLLRNGRLQATGHFVHDIMAKMQNTKTNETACPGVAGFLDLDWQQLDSFAKEVPLRSEGAQLNPANDK